MNIDEEWLSFISSGNIDDTPLSDIDIDEDCDIDDRAMHIMPSLLENKLYISTKTNISYLNIPIDLNSLFWKIPIISYATPFNGVIKKQIKYNSVDIEDFNFIQNKIKDIKDEGIFVEEHIITHIDNPSGRVKFKDIRKISIGISKKDMVSYRCKKKSAFYNCVVLILRLKVNDYFKEFHVKIFNTGKLEIPGIQNEDTFQLILKLVVELIQPHIEDKLEYNPNSTETVLINSNFNCGYYINREFLYDILKLKYNIQCIYDPCSYPGIQCKFYYNPNVEIQQGMQISEENKMLYKNVSKISFMIFRTGSVLIVGKCDESVLMVIYNFLRQILHDEQCNIQQKNITETHEENVSVIKDKKKKIRKKTIMVSI
jgi:hypothetical protein